jgi:hypothetical protein
VKSEDVAKNHMRTLSEPEIVITSCQHGEKAKQKMSLVLLLAGIDHRGAFWSWFEVLPLASKDETRQSSP